MPSGFVGAVTCTGEFWWLYAIRHYLLLHLFGALPGTRFLVVRFRQILQVALVWLGKFGIYGHFASDGTHHSHHWWASLSDFCVYSLHQPVLVRFPSLLCLISFYRWTSVCVHASHWVVGYPLLYLGLYLSVGRRLHTWDLTFCRILLGRPIPFLDWFRVVHSSLEVISEVCDDRFHIALFGVPFPYTRAHFRADLVAAVAEQKSILVFVFAEVFGP